MQFIENLFDAKPTISGTYFPLLQRAASHYRFAPDVLLVKWLSGFIVEPPCAFSRPDLRMPKCEHPALSGSKFCQAHKCLVCDDLVVFDCQSTYKYCASHGCLFDTCPEARLPDVQLYCKKHSCSACLDENKASSSAALYGQCAKHPLFPCNFHNCSNPAVSCSSFCKDHAEADPTEDSTKCHAINSKKKPCQAKALPASSFCKDHAYLNNTLTHIFIFFKMMFYTFGLTLHCACRKKHSGSPASPLPEGPHQKTVLLSYVIIMS